MAGNRFKLPQVRNHPDRFCHFCGLQVKAAWNRCESNDCRTPKKELPHIPTGWSLCPTCRIGFIQVGDHFCTLCHFRTTLGRDWQTAESQLNRKIHDMKQALNQRYGQAALAAGGEIAAVVGANQAIDVVAGAGGGIPAADQQGGGFDLDIEEQMLLAE